MRKNPQPLTNFGQGAKRYETEKKIWGGDRGNQYTKVASGKDCHLAESAFKTAKKLADEYSVSERTIRYDESYSKAVDVLPEKIKDDVLSGDTLLRKTDAEIIVKMPKPTQKKFLKEVESGTPIKEAVKKL